MKRIIFILAILAAALPAQTFKVTRISGKAHALKSSGNTWIELKQGDCLSGHDIVETSANSYIQLSRDESNFLLKNDAAVNLNYIKKLTLNDLLLALAMEEVKKAQPKGEESSVRNTAVYGSKSSAEYKKALTPSGFGLKRLNGAKQLAESSYKETSVLAARETFRKYPETMQNVYFRIYFADVTASLGLNDEAYTEFEKISKMQLTKEESQSVHQKLADLKNRITTRY